MGPESSDDDEQGSKLGRKHHWDETYALELDNLQQNGDEGEIWYRSQCHPMQNISMTADDMLESAAPPILLSLVRHAHLVGTMQLPDFLVCG